MDIAIIQFPGSNCERETILAVKRAGMLPVEFLWNEPLEKLIACDGYIIVGGFSYEDRSRAGILAALDPILQVLKTQSELGKPILGICNGAQILVESGLVPGFKDYPVNIALTDNKRMAEGKLLGTGYYNAWIHMRRSDTHKTNAFTRHLTTAQQLKIPVAHAEGRFVIPPDLLDFMQNQGLAVFQYCNEQGEIIDEFPVNPNGSVNNIAAIGNLAGNVMAMMPHPERTTVGDPIFCSMRDYIASYQKPTLLPPPYSTAIKLSDTPTSRSLSAGSRDLGMERDVWIPRTNRGTSKTSNLMSEQPSPFQQVAYKTYVPAKSTYELIIELTITDNQALSVQQTLRTMGIPVSIKRQIHWEIACHSRSVLHQIQASGLLYNENKERVVEPQKESLVGSSFLVRAKEDLLGLQKMQQLKQHFQLEGITALCHGVLWRISADPAHLDEASQQVINSSILFNPSSHECFYYA